MIEVAWILGTLAFVLGVWVGWLTYRLVWDRR